MTAYGSLNNIEGLKAELTDSYMYLLLIVNDGQNLLETDVTIKLQNPPTLDELVGSWPNTTMTITDLYIDPALLEAYTDMVGEMLGGCETESGSAYTVDTIESLVGEAFPVTMTVAKVTDTAGTLTLVQEGDESAVDTDEPLPFEYNKGKITAYLAEEGAEMTLDLSAFYVDEKTVGIEGTISLQYEGNMLTATIVIKGETALVIP